MTSGINSQGVKRRAAGVATLALLLCATASVAQASTAHAGLPSITIQSGSQTLSVTLNNAANPLPVPCSAFTINYANLPTNHIASIAVFNGTSTVASNTLSTGTSGSLSVAVPALSTGTYSVNTKVNTVPLLSLTFYISVTCTSDGSSGSNGVTTPELGSGALLGTGCVVIGAVLFYRRRRVPADKSDS